MSDPAEDPFPRLLAVGDEMRRDVSYRWDNANRSGAGTWVLQATLRGRAFFEDASGRCHAGPGEALLFRHGEDSRYGFPPGDREPYVLRFAAFGPGVLRPLLEHLRARHGPVVRHPPDGAGAGALAAIAALPRALRSADSFADAERLLGLLAAVARDQVEATRLEDPVAYAAHLIDTDFRERLGLKQIAARAGISREHLAREYRRRHGRSPGEALRARRLDHARRLRAATSATLDEIARASGLGSGDALARAWRRGE